MQVQAEGNPTSSTYALRKDVQDQPSLKNQHTSKISNKTDSPSAHFFHCTMPWLDHHCETAVSRWTKKLAAPVLHMTSRKATARQKAALISQAGWEVKHTQHVKAVV